jgi:UDP-N-acetylglucosamine diphosphorylase/glucosamine-1-phosphate N-acetyltransferase
MSRHRSLGVVILAAGQGKRMKSSLPKVLHKVAGRPMVSHVIERAKQLMTDKIVIVVGNQKSQVINELADDDIIFVEQKVRLGTGHAVLQTKGEFEDFDGDILILSGDVPLITQMSLDKLLGKHYVSNAAPTVLTAIFENPFGYGRIIRNKNGSLDRIVEEKDCSHDQRSIHEINAGTYVFESKQLFQWLPEVDCENVQNEYYLPDVLPLIKAGGGVIALEQINDIREIAGINTQEQLAEVNRIYEEIHGKN